MYAGGRPSTRAKDLVDLVLMTEVGLLPHPRLGDRLRDVFEVRDGGAPPEVLPAPPESWVDDYATLCADTASTLPHLTEAFVLVDGVYRSALGIEEDV